MLDKKEHENEQFKKTSFADQQLIDKRFQRCFFINCDFSRSNLSKSHFIDCTFKGCNLSNTLLGGTRFQNTNFNVCKLVGINFCPCDALIFTPCFENCLIRMCNFSELSLKRTIFSKSVIHETDFVETNLEGANLSHCDLAGTIFHKTNLRRTNFQYAKNYRIDPVNNRIQGAQFSTPEVLSLLSSFEIRVE